MPLTASMDFGISLNGGLVLYLVDSINQRAGFNLVLNCVWVWKLYDTLKRVVNEQHYLK
jgi:hypothetical protein